MTMTSEKPNRRAVTGVAHKDCAFCGRTKRDKNGNPLNYQYFDEATGTWHPYIYCSKVCYKAWRTMNGA